MVSHFFESAFSKSNGVSSTFWNELEEGSLLADEARFIMGDNWREELVIFKNNFK